MYRFCDRSAKSPVAREIHHRTTRDSHDGAVAQGQIVSERDHLYLLPPSFGDSLPEDHPAWRVRGCGETMTGSDF